MLDPVLQSELKKATRTVLFVHISILCEPFIYMAVALVLKEVTGFEGVEGSEGVIHLLRSIFVLLSALMIPGVIFLRRLLLSPERIVSADADVGKIARAYSRAQVVVDTFAALPATLGFVLFLLGEGVEILFVLSAVSIAMLVFLFPRYETLEGVVLAGIARGETIRAGGRFDGNA